MARTRLRHSVPTHTRISAIKQQTPPQPAKYAPNEKRGISRSSKLNYPGKDSHCRKSIVTEAIDGQNAQQDDALFNPKSTDPELQRTEAGAISRVGLILHFLPVLPKFISSNKLHFSF